MGHVAPHSGKVLLVGGVVGSVGPRDIQEVSLDAPGVSHGGVVDAGASDATKWIRDRFKK